MSSFLFHQQISWSRFKIRSFARCSLRKEAAKKTNAACRAFGASKQALNALPQPIMTVAAADGGEMNMSASDQAKLQPSNGAIYAILL